MPGPPVHPVGVADLKAGLDPQGQVVTVHSGFYSPHMFDARPLGAILAGMSAGTTKPSGFLATEWPYDKIKNRVEQVYSMANIAGDSAHGGLRGLIMRTPGQRQQNFALESLMNEAAAAVQTDPIEFRLKHTTDSRLIAVINATAKAAGWQTRPSGKSTNEGRGICVMTRAGLTGRASPRLQ